jgi:predicted lipid-binding transport protein (Tim44 family)
MTLFPRILSIALLFTASMFMVIQDAEAKRFGGGRSMGRSANYSRPATPARSTTQANRANQTQQRSGMGRFMGPLAGLAAGGLLAAMFMGGGFEGIQFFDIIIIALLVFGGIWLFRRMRAGSGAQRQPHAVGAGGGGNGNPGGFQVPDIGSGVGGGSAEPATKLSQQGPPWFDAAGFLKGAKQQFITMQKAWDNHDLKKIAETVTPEMYKELKQEIDSMGDNRTEVVTLNAELLGFTYEPNVVIVHVRMTGLIREQSGAQPEPFDEVWLVQRATNTQQANWYVAGIQQNA